MIGAIKKLTLPMPLKISQRGACASCQSLPTTATPSSHPKKNVAITRTQCDRMIDWARFGDESTLTARAWRAACVDASGGAWHKLTMSMLDAVKDKVVGQAMRFMSDPRISRVMGDQRVMSAAMKAVGVGGSIKAELDRATRFAAGLLGFATQEEVSALRSTVQTLEDNLAVMESKAQSTLAQNGGPTTHGAVR